MAFEPAAQAVATAELGPLVPSAIAASPEAMLGIIIGTVNGLTRPGPLPSKNVGLGFHREQAAHTRANDHADPVRVGIRDLQTCVGDGLLGCHHPKFAEAIPAFGFLGLNQASGIKCFYLCCKATGMVRRIKQRDPIDAVAS